MSEATEVKESSSSSSKSSSSKSTSTSAKDTPAAAADQSHVLELYPENVTVSPVLNQLRDRTTPEYKKSVESLAASIKDGGQIVPALVRATDDGFLIVAGQRRHDAVTLLRSRGDEIMLKCVVAAEGMSDDSALQTAMIENVQRRNFTPIEFANNVVTIREKFGWKGTGGTQKVADWLKINKATVTEAERLLGLPDEIKAKVSVGGMSPAAALEFAASVEKKKQEEVLVKAQKEADTEAKRKEQEREAKRKAKEKAAEEKAKAKAKAAGKKPERRKKEEKPVKTEAKKKGPAKIEQKHVRKAAKALNAVSKARAPKISEVKELFEQWTGPAFPKVMVAFATGGLEYLAGKLTEKKLTALWDDVADRVGPDKEPKEPKQPKQPKFKPTKPVAMTKAGTKAKKTKAVGKPVSRPKRKAA